MTNTKFRKRALLSSVAMLLVALVALGSATFAWYQASTSVYAEGMKFTTNASSGLLIATASEFGTANDISTANWGSSANLDAADVSTNGLSLYPASLNTSDRTFWQTSGQSEDNGSPKDTPAVTSATGNYVLTDKIYFKLDDGDSSAGTVNFTGITIDATKKNNTNSGSATYAYDTAYDALLEGIRVAVFKFATANETTTYTLLGEYSLSGQANETYYQDATPTTGTKNITAVSSFSTVSSIATCTQTASDAQGVQVYVYLDGFQSGVKTANAKKILANESLLDSITLNFALAS